MFPMKFGFDQALSEEMMFEYYGNIHVYCTGVGANEPLESILCSESLIFSPTARFLQDFPSKWHFNSFPHFNAYAT